MTAFPYLVNLNDLSPGMGFVIENDRDFEPDRIADFGRFVSSAGDVNGDGFDDFLVGSFSTVESAFLFFGKESGYSTLTLGTMTSSDGIRVQEPGNSSVFGRALSTAGDFNGDGIDDFMFGSPNSASGNTYLVFGKTGPFTDIDVTTLSPSEGFKVSGAAVDDDLGFNVSFAGDLNNDGFDDIIIGAPHTSVGEVREGSAYVLYGKSTGFGDIDVANLNPSDGFSIVGGAVIRWVGRDSSSAGDVNNDGYDDIILGTDDTSAYVIYGGPTRTSNIDLDTSLSATDGFAIESSGKFRTGLLVSNGGDLNGDGLEELIVTAYEKNTGVDNIFVIFGKSSGFGTIDLDTLALSDGFSIDRGKGYHQSVSSAGDVNGDGFDDLVFLWDNADRHSGFDDGETAFVLYGKASGFADLDVTSLTSQDGFVITNGARVEAIDGVSAAGDINGDGFDDLVLGARSHFEIDKAFVVYGRGTTSGTAAGEVLNGTFLNNTLDGLGGDDTLFGGGAADTLIGGAGADTLDGGAAHDLASYATSTTGISAFLGKPGSNTGDAVGDVYTSIEGLEGSAFADTLAGDAGDNTLIGGAGADLLIGGAGLDTVSYATSATGVLANMTARGNSTGDAAGDVLVNVENLSGTTYDDTLVGHAGDNTLTGGHGVDFLAGHAGDDLLFGGTGADSLFGGLSFDTVSYADAGARVQASLRSTQKSQGDAEGDHYRGIEALIGTKYDDVLRGTHKDNALYGGDGDDWLIGGDGGDILVGGDGFDTASYRGAGSGRVVSLEDPTINTGGAIGDTFVSIERLLGTRHSDTLIGDANDNELEGQGGDDVLKGRAGNDSLSSYRGKDILEGGSGDDILFSRFNNDSLFGGEGNDTLDGGHSADYLEGGLGADVFHYYYVVESDLTSGRDTIADFSSAEADTIDLSNIDADTTTAGNQAFTYIGAAAFSAAAQLRFVFDATNGYLQADVDGDGTADMNIALTGITNMSAGDFVL